MEMTKLTVTTQERTELAGELNKDKYQRNVNGQQSFWSLEGELLGFINRLKLIPNSITVKFSERFRIFRLGNKVENLNVSRQQNKVNPIFIMRCGDINNYSFSGKS